MQDPQIATDQDLRTPKYGPRVGKPKSTDTAIFIFNRFMRKMYSNPENPDRPAVLAMGKKLLRRLKPIDAVEEMLAAQALMTHARLTSLAALASASKFQHQCVLYNTLADSTSKTFHRQMQQLIDYRRPRKKRSHFTAIKQANIAAQQIVTGDFAMQKEKKEPNHGHSILPAEAQAQLQAHPPGKTLPPPHDPLDPALD